MFEWIAIASVGVCMGLIIFGIFKAIKEKDEI